MRRLRKSDNNRIARACGATIVNRTDELKEEDVGVGAGLFEIKKVIYSTHLKYLFELLSVTDPKLENSLQN